MLKDVAVLIVTENYQSRENKESCMLMKDFIYKDLYMCTIALNGQIDANSIADI